MSKRDSYIFYRNWWESFRNLPNDLRLEIYDGIMQYAFDGENKELSIVAEGFINIARPLLDKDRAKYESICERNKLNGSKGGRPKTQTKPRKTQENPLGSLGYVSETQNNPEKPYNDKMINDNDNINNNKPKGYEKFDFSFVEDSFREIFYKWLDYKRTRGEKYKAQSSLETSYKKLNELSNNSPADAEKIVDNSIANNWAGIFPLRDLFGKDGINTGKIQKEGFGWKQ